jgi:guanylate kinase
MIIYCIYGLSGSGKSTLEKKLLRSGFFSTVKAYTSRPIRASDSTDAYTFVEKKYFKENKEKFLYISEFLNEYYGVLKEDIDETKPVLLVSSYNTIKALQENKSIQVILIKNDVSFIRSFIRLFKRDGWSKRLVTLFKEESENKKITPDILCKT